MAPSVYTGLVQFCTESVLAAWPSSGNVTGAIVRDGAAGVVTVKLVELLPVPPLLVASPRTV
ncbi:MAG: hypothetical protein IPP98_03170 [Gemmatimonadetes bacterium]|nr:hypothetical protein [Gemmatimonadota bacterium]